MNLIFFYIKLCLKIDFVNYSLNILLHHSFLIRPQIKNSFYITVTCLLLKKKLRLS